MKKISKADKVVIVAPAAFVKKEDIQKAIDWLESLGLEVEFSKHLFSCYNAHAYTYGGTIQERLEDLQTALDNQEAKIIWAARGGYGCNQLIDLLDFTSFKKYPKWLIGYSDITVLHNKINALGFPSIHGINLKPFSEDFFDNPKKDVENILFHVEHTLNSPKKGKNLKPISGKLVGGNLSILYSQISTFPEDFFEDKILFIEDIGENLYHTDRILRTFKKSGVFDKIKALLVGSFTKMDDDDHKFYSLEFNPIVEQIVVENLSDYDFPIFFGVSAGHLDENRALVLGSEVSISLDKEQVCLTFDSYKS